MSKKVCNLLVAILVITFSMTLLVACGNKKDESKNDSKESVNSETDVSVENEEKFEPESYNIAMLKGPTAIGFVKAWDDSDNGNTENEYKVTAYGTADEITAGIVKGDIDIAAVPCNLASVLYNKTEGKISVAAINTLGVLYMVSDDDSISSVADLKGKTIYTTGQGTTPEYTLNYILKENGLTPGEDVTIEYKSEATEVSAMLSKTSGAIAMLPQPYVTSVLMQNENMSIVLDMTEEWNKVSDGNDLVTGVVIVRNEVVENNPKAFEEFMKDYESSTLYATENIEETANLVEAHDIFKAAVATKAIPYCNIKFIKGEEMKSAIENYLNVLFEANPQSVGGKLPADEFYR